MMRRPWCVACGFGGTSGPDLGKKRDSSRTSECGGVAPRCGTRDIGHPRLWSFGLLLCLCGPTSALQLPVLGSAKPAEAWRRRIEKTKKHPESSKVFGHQFSRRTLAPTQTAVQPGLQTKTPCDGPCHGTKVPSSRSYNWMVWLVPSSEWM